MAKMTFDHVCAMYRLAQDMVRYDKESAGYRRPAGLAGLFSRTPRNPFPRRAQERTLWYAQSLFSVAYRGAFPDMVAYSAGPEGPEHKIAKMDVSLNSDGELQGYRHEFNSRFYHDEHFEFRSGYGLRHAYSHSEDRHQDARNRNLAYARAMDGRFADDPFFQEYDRKADTLCDRLRQAEYKTFDAATMQRMVSEIEAYRKEAEEERRRLDAAAKASKPEIISLEDYTREYYRKELLKREFQDRRRENTEENRSVYNVRANALAEFRYGQLPDRLAERLPSRLGEYDDRLVYAQWRYEMITGRNPNTPGNAGEFIDSYISFARLNGAGREEIADECRGFAERNGVPDIAAGIQGRVDRILKDTESTLIGKFHDSLRDIACQAVPSSPETLVFRYEDLNADLGEQRERLVSAYKARSFLRTVSEVTGKQDLDSVAEEFHDSPDKASLRSIADAIVLKKGQGLDYFDSDRTALLLQSRVDALTGKDFLNMQETLEEVLQENNDVSFRNSIREGGLSGMRGTVSDPSVLLANDMAKVAFSFAGNVEDEPQKVRENIGAFLRENGVELKRNGTLGQSFRKAAREMYGDGGKESAERVAAFRERYAVRIKAMAAPAPAARRVEVSRRVSGPRL